VMKSKDALPVPPGSGASFRTSCGGAGGAALDEALGDALDALARVDALDVVATEGAVTGGAVVFGVLVPHADDATTNSASEHRVMIRNFHPRLTEGYR
jgi:hypothetical protein